MRRILAGLAAVLVALAPAAPAAAWGDVGHQYVGNLAWALLSPNARTQVNILLGRDRDGRQITLARAALWPDCLRGVAIGGSDNRLHYDSDDRLCATFGDNPADRVAMEAYVGRNWDNCVYAGRRQNCHKSFHFTGVNLAAHGDYRHAAYGMEDSDVVYAILAAITVLACPEGQVCATTGPFRIDSKRDALFLLAHFVGDLHQPLHAGGVWLDAGHRPTSSPAGVATAGGNLLLLTAGDTRDNLHQAWDTVGLGVRPTAEVIAAALRVPCPGALIDRPDIWASESVAAAGLAYQGLAYAPDTTPGLRGTYWTVAFSDRAAYDRRRAEVQAGRLLLGGARLAQVLNEVLDRPQGCA